MNEGGAVPVPGFPSDSHVWREFCPGYQDTPDGGPMAGAPAGNWTRPGTLCSLAPPPFPQAPLIIMPTLASDGQSRIALLDYEGTTDSTVHAVYRDNIAIRTATQAFQTVNPLSGNFGTPSGAVFLDHLGMTSFSNPVSQSCGNPNRLLKKPSRGIDTAIGV